MLRIALVVLLALALAGGAFLLLRSGDEGAGGSGGSLARDVVEEGPRAELAAPSLVGTGTGPRPRSVEIVPNAAPGPGVGEEIVLTVRVVDDATGAGVAAARVAFERAASPCPRLPPDALAPGAAPEVGAGKAPFHATDRDGRLALPEWAGLRAFAPLDVFARAPGYVVGTACGVSVPGEALIRLVKGLTLGGKVTDRQGKRLPGATLRAAPGVGTPALPGHSGGARTDDQGRFEMDGLVAGPLALTVAREGFVPLRLPAEDPADGRERTYVLAPAYTVRFRLRTDDGREVVSPTLEARAPGRPPFQAVQILTLSEDRTHDGRLTEGVPLPATLGAVDLEVKAEGYAAWRALGEAVPPEGGEITYAVTLQRDAGQGGVKLTFEDDHGQTLKYAELRPSPPSIQPLERQDLAGGIVYEAQDALRFPSLPPGRYRFGAAAFAYAPAVVEVTVVGGTETEVRVTLRAAARLKVRFVAPSPRLVRFQLLQGRLPVTALPETPPAPRADPSAPEDAALAAGADGLLLGGLATGTYVVEVVSDDLLPSRTSVQVREGETEEVEIRVQPR